MGKANSEQKQGKLKSSIKTGVAATGFITAVIVVLIIAYMFEVDMSVLAGALAIVLVLCFGVPLFLHARREGTDRDDENETCAPILASFEKHHSTDRLIADYRKWTEGEHSTYTRVHFGGDIVYTLQGAKAYEEALEILEELDSIEMKPRERYDYETYRDKVKPELLEGIETEARREKERARNKNLRK